MMETKFEFKGNNQYSQEVLAEVQKDLTKAIKILRDIDHNFAFVEGCDLEYAVVATCQQLLSEVSQNLYAVRNK
jgi:hypothetical protein